MSRADSEGKAARETLHSLVDAIHVEQLDLLLVMVQAAVDQARVAREREIRSAAWADPLVQSEFEAALAREGARRSAR